MRKESGFGLDQMEMKMVLVIACLMAGDVVVAALDNHQLWTVKL